MVGKGFYECSSVDGGATMIEVDSYGFQLASSTRGGGVAGEAVTGSAYPFSCVDIQFP